MKTKLLRTLAAAVAASLLASCTSENHDADDAVRKQHATTMPSRMSAALDDDSADASVAAPSVDETAAGIFSADKSVVDRIRDEGMKRSEVMATLSHLTDVIGPRLTGSPALKQANEWTRDSLAKWGLSNAHLESWGPFGKGWTLKRFSAEIVGPQSFPLIAYPKAWSAGLDKPLVARVIHVNPANEKELEALAGKLEGAIILLGPSRPLEPHFKPEAIRFTDDELAKLAAARGGNGPSPLRTAGGPTTEPTTQSLLGPRRDPNGRPTSRPTSQPELQLSRVFSFCVAQKAAMIVTSGRQDDGGNLFVASASLPGSGIRLLTGPRPWSVDVAPTVPQMELALEQFNRLTRMLKDGVELKAAINLEVEYQTQDLNCYNTIAEIPGTDLKDEVVMIGAHLDSWHSGTGATDNGCGTAAVMEAVRILKALDLHPRRTIRIALWTGEEEGLYGSRAYVKQHFGQVVDGSSTRPTTGPTTDRAGGIAGRGGRNRGGGGGIDGAPTTQPGGRGGFGRRNPTTRKIEKLPEYEKLSVYFNLDNGSGKIRGVFAQSSPLARPIFAKWLLPFHDLGATTVTLQNTGSTDHISFTDIDLPGFQFIQDPLEYGSRTHHSSEDVYDRAQEDDMKQASTIMAAFLYDASMMDGRFPRFIAPPTTRPQR